METGCENQSADATSSNTVDSVVFVNRTPISDDQQYPYASMWCTARRSFECLFIPIVLRIKNDNIYIYIGNARG